MTPPICSPWLPLGVEGGGVFLDLIRLSLLRSRAVPSRP